MPENKKRVKAVPISHPSPALGYQQPRLDKVATEFEFDSDVFRPMPVDGSPAVLLSANVPENFVIPAGATSQIDCGLSMDVPAAFQIVFRAVPRLASIGLLANGVHTKGRVTVVVTNAGGQEITINPGDAIVSAVVQPVYWFDWFAKERS